MSGCFIKVQGKSAMTIEYKRFIHYASGITQLYITSNSVVPNQIAFHDCVGPDGCDGCIDANAFHNLGLNGLKVKLVDLRANKQFQVGAHFQLNIYIYIYI